MYLGRHIWIYVRACNWLPASSLSQHASCPSQINSGGASQQNRTLVAWYTLQKYLLMVVELCNIPLRRDPVPQITHCRNAAAPFALPGAAWCRALPSERFQSSKKSILGGVRGEGCSRDTRVEMVQVPLSTSTPPWAQTCPRFSYQAPSPLQISDQGSLLVAGWSLGCPDWSGSRGTGGGWEESRAGAGAGMHRLVGKAERWKGSVLYCSNTSFPCTQAKVTRCMIYLAQGKQLFRGSAGVFRQSCSVPEESHLQMLTASFYPLPASRSPAALSPSGLSWGCLRLSLSPYVCLRFNFLKFLGLPGSEGHPSTVI